MKAKDYTLVSAEMDDILFQYDITMCQAQYNLGTQLSFRQAWAKNVVSVGGVYHLDSVNTVDDSWGGPGDPCAISSPASHGPAEDLRIKPDFTHFYDQVLTTNAGLGNPYNLCFNGTSAATPITCGYFGLFYQMWSWSHFGNPVQTTCNPNLGNCVFLNRPHMTTAKAMMINTSRMYAFAGPDPPNGDLTRDKQGWGLVDVGKLYVHGVGDKFKLIVDETDLVEMVTHLGQTASYSYPITVDSGTFELKVTMVYADPMGNPTCPEAYVNDLNLRVTSPSQVVYWGNTGLLNDNWSDPGGPPNAIAVDTVENVFVKYPEPGQWTVVVRAMQINQDGHVETSELDADFALVVSMDFDCNLTTRPDSYDIARGDSLDDDNDGIPNECDNE